MAYVISSACTRCGACLPECPTGSIIEGEKQYTIDADTCADHACCVAVCPVDAITPLAAAVAAAGAGAPAGKPRSASAEWEEEED
jgi:ferredoxin